MSIHKLIANGSFGPAEIELMTTAYEAALIDLRLADGEDPINELIAKANHQRDGSGRARPERSKRTRNKRARRA